MRLSQVALTTSMAVATIAAPATKHVVTEEDLGIGLGLDGGVSIRKRNSVPNEESDIGIKLNADGSITHGKRVAAPDEDTDIGVGLGATFCVK